MELCFSSLEEYARKQGVLKRHCQAVERDYATIVQAVHAELEAQGTRVIGVLPGYVETEPKPY